MDSVPATPSSQIFKGLEAAETPIVDGSILEAAKENIQPLARGRRATALSQALSTPHRERLAHLAQEREQMRANLAQAIEDDEDPLAAYLAFVDWTIESYPQGHNSDSGLITLFDEATRTLKDDPRYKNDLRYLKLWVLYASNVEKPVDMFAFLLANDVGTVHTLFYEEYALALERDGRRSEADEMYRLGINRRVRPLERLQTRYKEFQLRMMAGPLHEPAPAPAAPPTKRKALGQVSSRKAAPPPLRDSNPTSGSNARVQPFVDGEDGGVEEPGNEWPEFGTRAGRIKENARDVERAGDVKMKLAKGPARPAGAPIEVFRDEVPTAPQTPSATARTNAMTPAKGTSEAELLRRDPFRNYKKEAPAPSTSTSAPTFAVPAPVPSSKAAGIITDPYPNLLTAPAPGKRPEKHMFKLELLWSGGVESCIQEARARQLGLIGKKWPAPPMPEGASAVSVDFNENGKKTSKGFLSAAGAIPSEPTVTINTKAALADVYGMFNSPTRSMRPSDFPCEEIVVAPNIDENAGAKRNPISRAPSSENAMRPPPKGDDGSRKRPTPPTDAQFATPMQPKKAKNEVKASKGLSEKKPAFTPFRDDEAVTPKAFTIFRDEQEAPPASNDFSVFHDEPQEAPRRAFQPFVDEDESVVIPPPRATPSFRPFMDEDVAATPTPAFRPYVDDDEEEDAPPARAFQPFVDEDEDAQMDDVDAAVSFRDRVDALRPSTERTYETSRTGDFDRGFVEPGSVVVSGDESQAVLPPSLLCEDAAVPNDSFARVERPFRVSDGYTINPGSDSSMLPSFAGDTMTMSTMEFTNAVLPSGPQLQNLPNPCNAYSKQISHALLDLIDADSRCHRFDAQTSNKWNALQKFGASKGRKSNDTTIDLSKLILKLGSDTFEVTGKLGEGAFGAVYVARECNMTQLYDADGENGENGDLVAVKIVRPSDRWEFSMLARLFAALPRELHSSLIHPRSLYTYADESFFVMNLSKQGTLLDVINRAPIAKVAQAGGGLEEPLVQFFAIELMRLVTAMHMAGFIHGDLKIDNCMLRLDTADEWGLTYDPSGAHGWDRKGVRLIDFGRMIDTRMFSAGQTFTCDWEADEKDCMEVREGRPWTFQTDYFGLAAIVYTMLYGKHIDGVNVVHNGGIKRYAIRQPLKRYWQTDLWSRFFDMLLNPTSVRPDGALPICDELTALRLEMEESLRKSKKSLKGLLKKVEMATLMI